MKGRKTINFLEFISEIPSPLAEILAIFTTPYGSSFNKVNKRLEILDKYRRSRLVVVQKNQAEEIDKKAFHNLIYRLQKDELITFSKNEDNKNDHITNCILRPMPLSVGLCHRTLDSGQGF